MAAGRRNGYRLPPPAFIAAATDDPQVPSMQSIRTYSAWRFGDSVLEQIGVTNQQSPTVTVENPRRFFG